MKDTLTHWEMMSWHLSGSGHAPGHWCSYPPRIPCWRSPGGPSFKVLVAHSFRSNSSTICPRGHVLAEAPGPPGSVYQRLQYFPHDRLPSQCPNYSSLKAAGINPQDVHRPTFCLKERAQNVFQSGWYKWSHGNRNHSNFTSSCHYCYNPAFLTWKSTSGVIWRVLSVFFTASTLISQVLPFSLKILWFLWDRWEGLWNFQYRSFLCVYFLTLSYKKFQTYAKEQKRVQQTLSAHRLAWMIIYSKPICMSSPPPPTLPLWIILKENRKYFRTYLKKTTF